LKIQYLADENLRRAVVLGVRRREPTISFAEAFEVEASGKDDLAVLRIAVTEGRVLVSYDVRTMPRFFDEFIRLQRSPGLVLIPQRLAMKIAIEELVLLWIASEAHEWENRICFLPV
jgi:hypothetical protein